MANLGGLPIAPRLPMTSQIQDTGRAGFAQHDGPPTPQSGGMRADRRSQSVNALKSHMARTQQMQEGYRILVEENEMNTHLAKHWEAEAGRSKSEYENIRGQLNQATEDLSTLRREAKAANDHERTLRKAAENQIAEMSGEINTLKYDNHNSDISIALLQDQVNGLREEQAALKTDVDNKLITWEEEKTRLTAEKDATAQCLAVEKNNGIKIQYASSRLREDIDSREEKIKKLESEKRDCAKELEAARSKEETVQKSHAQQLEKLQSIIAFLKQDSQTTSKANDDLALELSAAGNTIAAQEDALLTTKFRVQTLEKRCNQLNDEALRVNAVQARISELGTGFDSKLSKIKHELRETNKVKNSLSEKNNYVQAESAIHAYNLRTAQKANQSQAKEITVLKQQNHTTAQERDDANGQKARLETEIAGQKETVKRLRTDKHRFEKQLEERKVSEEQMQKTMRGMKNDCEEHKISEEQMQKTIGELEDELDRVNKGIFDLSESAKKGGPASSSRPASKMSKRSEEVIGKSEASEMVEQNTNPSQDTSQPRRLGSGDNAPAIAVAAPSPPPAGDEFAGWQNSNNAAKHIGDSQVESASVSEGRDTTSSLSPAVGTNSSGGKVKMSLLGAKIPEPLAATKPSPLCNEASEPDAGVERPNTPQSPTKSKQSTMSSSKGKRKGDQHQGGPQRPPKGPRYPDHTMHYDDFDAWNTPRHIRRHSRRPYHYDNLPREANIYGRRGYH